MSSLFTGIQSWFESKNHGRYLALILNEIGNRKPEPLLAFVAKACKINRATLKGATFQSEYSFRGSKGVRRADLAIFLKDEEKFPAILIEIKYHDKPIKETETKPAQLDDYVAWKDEHPDRKVMILSRELFFATGCITRRWGDLARELRPYCVKSDLIAMLVTYLEEQGNVMQDINNKNLIGFFKRLVCSSRNAGTLANNLDGPAEFSKFLSNMRLLAVTFDHQFKSAWNNAIENSDDTEFTNGTRIATIDFRIVNRTSTKNQSKAFEDDDDKQGWLSQSVKNGGRIIAFARHALGHGHGKYMRIEYGFIFDVEPGDDTAVSLYAQAHGSLFGTDSATPHIFHQQKINLEHVTKYAEVNGEKTEMKLNKLLGNVIDELLLDPSNLFNQQKEALESLKKSLAAGRDF
ncbi:hypothetical protein [Janthinobacterium sp. SUN137]|uniref:hypothetical protein n=1 Tax=Janthinobacterium sp. SUN137 TaxID=3014789 RepID=UPI002714414E|nr:hypothetical protein [Janthinobacterium sp. SUN137]MDO8042477.1 hypothetical protein [Janthinobacterium sp. SUN137]